MPGDDEIDLLAYFTESLNRLMDFKTWAEKQDLPPKMNRGDWAEQESFFDVEEKDPPPTP